MNRERSGGLFFFLIGMYAFFRSIKLPLGTWSQPGPGVFPLILSILLSIVGALIFISGKGKARIESYRDIIRKQARAWQIIALTAAFIFAFDRVGYLMASALYMFFLFLWVCHFKLWGSVFLAGVLAPGSWYFFEKILGLNLPTLPWGL